jgi:hypothetical protein
VTVEGGTVVTLAAGIPGVLLESPAVKPLAAPDAPSMALNPIEPTATAPPATKAALDTKSPPPNAGDPPSTAANSLGICQQSIMKMIDAPMISSADMAGLAFAAMFCASVIQSTDKLIPVPIKRYRSMIFTPVDTPSPM